ncbi:DUF3576 domain-containing protein [Sneathiella sp. P13V-1]|uniref:DUF3576 domain-containing protein n=1 Tax=Sneathiella sp. P13V-1 TaxID=2697366 RepID=UPI00187B5000|nr:DUF3576 domain-containing protein [Sneathiella sp. P13V-1]MBE7636091.1 DUF3576 domain-containing protein [Sneathiella sp. P13V-1]
MLLRSLHTKLVIASAGLLMLSACGSNLGTDSTFPEQKRGQVFQEGADGKQETVFGDGGLLGGGSKSLEDGQGGGGIGVNSYLWRASLDTLSFMPLSSADPFGGVIITDWYTPAESPGERFKVTVYILDRRLRADGIRVSAFKQNLDTANNWVPVQLTPKTITNLENAILRRARELRISREGE